MCIGVSGSAHVRRKQRSLLPISRCPHIRWYRMSKQKRIGNSVRCLRHIWLPMTQNNQNLASDLRLGSATEYIPAIVVLRTRCMCECIRFPFHIRVTASRTCNIRALALIAVALIRKVQRIHSHIQYVRKTTIAGIYSVALMRPVYTSAYERTFNRDETCSSEHSRIYVCICMCMYRRIL